MFQSRKFRNSKIHADIVRTTEELLQVFTVRAAVYCAGQECPYHEEYDGNDFTCTHILGTVDGEPAGCMRLRWFAGFVKAERMAVLPRFRGSTIMERVLDVGTDLCRRKGYDLMCSHSQRRLVPLWRRYGFEPVSGEVFHYSDHEYVALRRPIGRHPAPVTLEHPPMVLNRPEGRFDQPGVLDQSASRGATNPEGEALAA